MNYEEVYKRIMEIREKGLRKMEESGTHLNSGTFPDPHQSEREWWCYSTALAPCWLMLCCNKTGAEGVVKDPTREEWRWAYDCPSNPKLWEDSSRVTVMKEAE